MIILQEEIDDFNCTVIKWDWMTCQINLLTFYVHDDVFLWFQASWVWANWLLSQSSFWILPHRRCQGLPTIHPHPSMAWQLVWQLASQTQDLWRWSLTPQWNTEPTINKHMYTQLPRVLWIIYFFWPFFLRLLVISQLKITIYRQWDPSPVICYKALE